MTTSLNSWLSPLRLESWSNNPNLFVLGCLLFTWTPRLPPMRGVGVRTHLCRFHRFIGFKESSWNEIHCDGRQLAHVGNVLAPTWLFKEEACKYSVGLTHTVDCASAQTSSDCVLRHACACMQIGLIWISLWMSWFSTEEKSAVLANSIHINLTENIHRGQRWQCSTNLCENHCSEQVSPTHNNTDLTLSYNSVQISSQHVHQQRSRVTGYFPTNLAEYFIPFNLYKIIL